LEHPVTTSIAANATPATVKRIGFSPVKRDPIGAGW
jgi:hypothetical protein